MSLADILKKSLRRLVPQEGMILDVQTWNAAHDYHSVNQRLHAASMHSDGVVAGLEVVAWDPPDNSVVINPGVAVDSNGGTIIVGEAQRFQLNTGERGEVYLILQYREISQDDSSNGTPQAQYVLEAYRIEERRQLPAEPYVELARVQVSGTGAPITEPRDPYNPAPDEIDMRHRAMSGPRAIGEISIGVIPLETTSTGQIVHSSGAMSLLRDINNSTRYQAAFKGSINLNEDIAGCDLVIVAGRQEFTLTNQWVAVLGRFIERGGVLLGEACGAGGGDGTPFKQSFIKLSELLSKEMAVVERGHPLFNAYHLFAKAPDGAQEATPLIVAGEGIVYTDGDYGCLWEGGRPDAPASRETIRAATELGTNIGVFASQRRHTRAVRLMA